MKQFDQVMKRPSKRTHLEILNDENISLSLHIGNITHGDVEMQAVRADTAEDVENLKSLLGLTRKASSLRADFIDSLLGLIGPAF